MLNFKTCLLCIRPGTYPTNLSLLFQDVFSVCKCCRATNMFSIQCFPSPSSIANQTQIAAQSMQFFLGRKVTLMPFKGIFFRKRTQRPRLEFEIITLIHFSAAIHDVLDPHSRKILFREYLTRTMTYNHNLLNKIMFVKSPVIIISKNQLNLWL